MDKNIKKFKNIVFVDTETTGLDPMKDRVIEIGVVKIDKDNNITKYSKLINPGFKISKEIRLITGIKINSAIIENHEICVEFQGYYVIKL